MKAAVTGGAGFIGSHLIEKLLGMGWDVTVVDDLSSGLIGNLPKTVSFIQGDINDKALLNAAFDGANAIFHLAAVSSVQQSLNMPLNVHNTNTTGTLAVLELAKRHRVKRVIYSSSAAVYGDTDGAAAREDMKPNPLSHYAAQKLLGEYYCAIYSKLYGIETVALRYFNVFGPRQCGDSPYSGVISKFISNAIAGKPLDIYGDGSQKRDFCHVSRVVSANVAAATRPHDLVAGRVFNVGTGVATSVVDLAAIVQSMAPQPIPVRFLKPNRGEISFSKADMSLANQHLFLATNEDRKSLRESLCSLLS